MHNPDTSDESLFRLDGHHQMASEDKIAWGAWTAILQTTAKNIRDWLRSQTPKQSIGLFAAAFWVSGIDKDAANWPGLGFKVSSHQRMFSMGFINDGEFSLP